MAASQPIPRLQRRTFLTAYRDQSAVPGFASIPPFIVA